LILEEVMGQGQAFLTESGWVFISPKQYQIFHFFPIRIKNNLIGSDQKRVMASGWESGSRVRTLAAPGNLWPGLPKKIPQKYSQP